MSIFVHIALWLGLVAGTAIECAIVGNAFGVFAERSVFIGLGVASVYLAQEWIFLRAGLS